MDALGLPERTGVGAFGAIVEPESVAPAVGHVRLGVAVVAARLRLHRHLSPRLAVDQDEAHPLGRAPRPASGPNRPRTRSPRIAAPAGHASSHSWGPYLASFNGIKFEPTVRIRVDAHDGPLALGHLLAHRTRSVISPRVAGAVPWNPRMLAEVPHVARPGARGFAAGRAEYRIPQAAFA